MQQTAVTAPECLTLLGMRVQALGAATEEQAALLGAGLDRPEADNAGMSPMDQESRTANEQETTSVALVSISPLLCALFDSLPVSVDRSVSYCKELTWMCLGYGAGDDMTDVAAAAQEAEPLPEAGGQLPERQVWLQIASDC